MVKFPFFGLPLHKLQLNKNLSHMFEVGTIKFVSIYLDSLPPADSRNRLLARSGTVSGGALSVPCPIKNIFLSKLLNLFFRK